MKSPKGEELLHCLRVPGYGCAVTRSVETVKYPSIGGTACVVETLDKTSHDGIGELVAEECDLVGLAEIPFLMDNDGRFRLIEINPRAWLQILLPHRAGFSMAYHAYRSMLGDPMDGAPFRQEPGKIWVNAERLILAALKRNSTVQLDQAIRSIRAAECVVMHDSKLPGLKLRWIARMLRRLFRKTS